MQTSLTTVDGIRLAARRTGRGTPVVLVHGSAGGIDSWDPVLPLLADDFELWVYARRGYPPSGACHASKTFQDDVTDLRTVLAAAGGSAHLVGGSYGATVALHAAGADSTGIRSLALFEPPLYAAGAEPAAALEPFAELLAAGDLAAANRLFAERVSRAPQSILAALDAAAAAPRDAAQRAAAAAEAVGCRHDLEALAADKPAVERWAHLAVPVLLMQGSDTWAPMPATMDALADVLPKVDRAVLAGQSHFATHTAPGLFADTLRRFLRAHG
jgi:pimeloyl-ACP methyl ester carboxylesterase